MAAWPGKVKYLRSHLKIWCQEKDILDVKPVNVHEERKLGWRATAKHCARSNGNITLLIMKKRVYVCRSVHWILLITCNPIKVDNLNESTVKQKVGVRDPLSLYISISLVNSCISYEFVGINVILKCKDSPASRINPMRGQSSSLKKGSNTGIAWFLTPLFYAAYYGWLWPKRGKNVNGKLWWLNEDMNQCRWWAFSIATALSLYCCCFSEKVCWSLAGL